MHRKVAAALVAVLALALAGCGGSEQTSLTRAELVRRVEQACRDAQRVGQRAARQARGEATGIAAFIQAALAGQRAITDRIEDYTTSGEAKADFEAFKDSMQARVEAIDRIASADRADQQRVIREVQADLDDAARRAQDAAASLGIEGCT